MNKTSRISNNCKKARLRVLYVGSGAVNLCLAGWMHSGTSITQFLVRTPENELIRTQAFQCRLPGDKNKRVYKCQAFASLDRVERPDLIVIGVKNYSLTTALGAIESAFGNEVPVMSVLNGVEHVDLISARFKDAIFATIAFNAFRNSQIDAVAVGGTVGLSASDPNSKGLEAVHKILKRKISVSLVKNPRDAAMCKLVINLGNALLTIVGFHNNRNQQLDILQKLTAEILNEGIDVLKKAEVNEAKISGMPRWFLIRLSKILPQKIILPIFEKKLKANSINSMAQDVAAGANQTELEDINGYFVKLADELGVEVPYNKALYHLFKKWLSEGNQEPVKPSKLLSAIKSFSNL